MKKTNYQYTLCCSNGSWDEIHIHSNDLVELKLEAFNYLKDGYCCFILDNKNKNQINMRLRSEPNAPMEGGSKIIPPNL